MKKYQSQGRVRVKICGITRVQDALAAVNLGADAIGFIFYKASPRCIDIQVAAEISFNLPPFISKVALFVNAQHEWIEKVLSEVSIDLLQFHGDEAKTECSRYRYPYVKAIRVSEETDIRKAVDAFSDASALLLDTFIQGKHGGTGETFDWSLIPEDLEMPIILAGGLNPDNVSLAIKTVRPYAVDVSGGVEQDKRMKDVIKISAFMKEVNNAR